MRGKLTLDLRTPVRGVLAATIAVVVGALSGLPRTHWAVLVAVLLINGTWGENIRRSMSRLGMTALGSVVAFAIYALIHGYQGLEIPVLLASVFLAAYYRNGSYSLMVFFITVYIVFLFAVLRLSVAGMLPVRIYQTGIGCAVAVVASFLVPAQRSQKLWEQQIDRFWESCERQVAAAFERLLWPRNEAQSLPSAARELQQSLFVLRDRHQASNYEGMFLGPAIGRRTALMNKARLLAHYVVVLSEAVELPRNETMIELLRAELDELCIFVMAQLAMIGPNAPPEAESAAGEMDRVQAAIYKKAIQLQQAELISRDSIVTLGPIVYSARQIGQLVSEILAAEKC